MFYLFLFSSVSLVVFVLNCFDTQKQGLPFHSTIVQKEFTPIAYAPLFNWRSGCDKRRCQRTLLYFLFYAYTQKILYVKKSLWQPLHKSYLKLRFFSFFFFGSGSSLITCNGNLTHTHTLYLTHTHTHTHTHSPLLFKMAIGIKWHLFLIALEKERE